MSDHFCIQLQRVDFLQRSDATTAAVVAPVALTIWLQIRPHRLKSESGVLYPITVSGSAFYKARHFFVHQSLQIMTRCPQIGEPIDLLGGQLDFPEKQ